MHTFFYITGIITWIAIVILFLLFLTAVIAGLSIPEEDYKSPEENYKSNSYDR